MAKYTDKVHKVHLTTDEVFTILLLVGKVVGDKESYGLWDKLTELLGRGATLEEQKRVKCVEETRDAEWYIRIEEGEKND